MPLVKAVDVRLSASGVEDAKLKIDSLAVKAEELKKINPTITPNIDSAKALIEARLLRAGLKAEFEKSITETVNVHQSAISRIAGAAGGGIGAGLTPLAAGGLGPLPAFLTSPVALAGVAAAAAAVLVELTGLVSGFAAATAGIGAFGALALPTFDKIKNAYTAISTAQKNYNAAVAINKEDPTKAHATAAAAALLKLKVAQESMGPSTRAAVTGIQDLMKTFDKMATAFQPTVMKVFNDALKVANNLLPTLTPFATAAGNALDGLLKTFGKFTQTGGFKDWIKQFSSLTGPAITAIGQGFGNVAVNVGKLLTAMSKKDVVNAINIAFRTISGTITGLTWLVTHLMSAWDTSVRVFANVVHAVGNVIHAFDNFNHAIDNARHAVAVFASDVGHYVGVAVAWFTGLPGRIVHAVGNLGGLLVAAGRAVIAGLIAGIESEIPGLTSIVSFIEGLLGRASSAASGIGNLAQTGPGRVTHKAAGGYASGLTLVGELGPELVSLPSGSFVHSNSQSQQMMGNTYVINQYSLVPSAENGRQIVNALKQFERGSGSSWRK